MFVWPLMTCTPLHLKSAPGQVGECVGPFSPADGTVQRAARPRPQDRSSTKVAAGGPGLHQGPDLQALQGTTSHPKHYYRGGKTFELVGHNRSGKRWARPGADEGVFW